MSTFSAGIGDPYWYEWTVGLQKIVEMLHPENEITAVTLQTSEIQGWDDVRVEYHNCKIEYFQIKHSRVDDTLTFGDLVSINNDKSLLSYLADCWKSISYHNDSKFILYTNREVGNRKATVIDDGRSITRPALTDFFNEIKIQSQQHKNINDLQISEENRDAYELEWLPQLSKLTDNEKLKFLRQLELKAGQENLEELEKRIINSISTHLGITEPQALSILKSLNHALRKWVTSRRANERITKEDVYQELRVPEKEIVGEHNLDPPYPFFMSREKEIKELLDTLDDQSIKVIFLTGPPGIGKTSIISKLSNSHNPSIPLRYYTFKPIAPDNDLLPADAGNTTKAKYLWGDLLSQIRILFRGNLAKYKIPIRNDFISDVDILRNEVVRLSRELSKRTNQRTVICIDGIDHAARAELDLNENYLESLIPPDSIPKELLFIISGQPPEFYDKYPIWLKEERKEIKRINISNLTENDIKILLKTESVSDIDHAAEIILNHTNGNTLSVLYAIETIKKCSSIENAVKKFEDYHLKDGLNIYYDKIWANSSITLKDNLPSLLQKIASVFSLTAGRLNAKHINYLIPEYGADDWSILLSKMSPLIVYDGGFRVLHNDVKVYFTKIIKSADDSIYKEISLKLFQLYLNEKNFEKQLHNEAIKLLTKADQTHKILEILNPKFILEAYIYNCSLDEVEKQIRLALDEAIKAKSVDRLHDITCCIKSLSQLNNEIEGTDILWNDFDISQKFTNELRVVKKELWNLRIIDEVLIQTLNLLRSSKLNRARGLVQRWFQNLRYSELIQLLPNEILFTTHPGNDEQSLTNEFEGFWNNYGKIIAYTMDNIIVFDVDDNLSKNVLAHITGGILEETVNLEDRSKILSALETMPGYYFKKNYDDLLLALIKKQDWINIFLLLKNIKVDCLTDKYKIFAIFSALISKSNKLISKWYGPFKNNLIDLVREKEYASEFYYLEYTLYSVTCFILGWKDWSKDISEIVESFSNSVLTNHRENAKTFASKQLFRNSVLLGRWFCEIYDDNKRENFVSIDENKSRVTLENLLSFPKDIRKAHIQTKDATSFLLNIIIYCFNSSTTSYSMNLNDTLLNQYTDELVYDYHFQIIWKELYQKGYYKECELFLGRLIGHDGQLWKWQNFEKFDSITELLELTRNTSFKTIVEEARNRSKWFVIGISSHKDYSLYFEAIWLEEIFLSNPEKWNTEGLKLLTLSNRISDLGDNQASNYVNKLIMFAAIKSGPSDAHSLYRLMKSKYQYWRTFLTDALIDFINYYTLDKDKINLIWLFGCGYLYWCQYYDRKEIYRLKKTILDHQFVKSNPDIVSFMEESNSIEFNIDTIAKIDENEYRPDNYEFLGSIEENIDKFFSSDSKDFDLLTAIVINIKEERPSNFYELVTKIYEFVLSQQVDSYWGDNRYGKVYKELIPLLSEDRKWKIASNIVKVFCEVDSFKNYYSFSENLNYFCLYYSRDSFESLMEGYNRSLSMHNEWITGFNNDLLFEDKETADFLESQLHISNWSEFAIQLLIEKLDSRSGIMTEYSLRAIWQIIKYDPSMIAYIDSCWKSFSDDQKEYLLIIFELIPSKLSDKIDLLKPILIKVYSSSVFSHKIQVFLIYCAINRINGDKVSEIPMKVNSLLNIKKNIDYPYQSIFEVKGSESAFYSPIKNYHHLFQRKIEFLEAATGYDLKEYLNENLSYLISQIPFSEDENMRSDLIKDFKISSREPDEIFNTIIQHELAIGNMNDVPIINIIQALSINDEPYAFENKYLPHPDISIWPEERKEIENPEELLKSLLTADNSDDNIILCGEVRFYTSHKAYRGFLNSYVVPPDKFLLKYRDSSTFNACSSFFYHKSVYHTQSPERSLFTIGGGISKLLYSNNWIIPSNELFKISGWTIDITNPYILLIGNKKVAWLEKFIGPINTVDYRYDRQSAIQRWVCKKTSYEEIKSSLEKRYIIKHNFKFESSNISDK